MLGGARSGKSRYAEGLAEASGLAPVYIATAQDFGTDGEMAARIAHHKDRRGPNWRSIEAPFELGAAILHEAAPGRVVVVDCLTLWLTNLMLAERDVADEAARFAALFETPPAGPVLLISNEVGLGIVPDNRMAREFRDHAGLLHQSLGTLAARVVFVAAGLPLLLKG
ncbi:adenosylcobinamide kinase/adenosylcobinamide phosphate guanyltransferase [Aureimonas endophytica]|uniref:Bifunctional adenosylcobalamin biosynthesis protein n=1 Tax=Aureimonas endophytica TaxID=2027858 RepID=A0A916ZWH5_9HYPH|nr:adenosylcobinamide kinase/adenosylcobinamide phosphate guanyltransferase [Aureimonas endophytica]